MIRSKLLIPFFVVLFACQERQEYGLNEEILFSLGNKSKMEFSQMATDFREQIASDSTNIEALLGLTEMEIILYVFGYNSREETIPKAREAFDKAQKLDALSTDVQAFSGILSMLDWDWRNAEKSLKKAIEIDTENLRARHWYSLYLSAMGKFEEAMAQSDTIATMDPEGNYLIGRGSLLYFARRNEEMKELMIKTIVMDTSVAWGYDWLGMAYAELEEFDKSIETYYKAFELSDGTVEVGAGLGHALGLAGYYEPAKQMADYYSSAAKDHYLPPVQRAFVHIGIGEHDEAISLLEQAYEEHSWFLIFMKIEPWYDPIRNDEGLNKKFNDIIKRMHFPQ